MPSVGRFLELFEAISRRDWGTIREVGQLVAEEERQKKHYSAAHRIIEAVEVALSNSGYDRIGNVSAPTFPIDSAIPDLLHEEKLDTIPTPILNSALRQEINELIGEWQFQERLLQKGLQPRHTLLLYGPPGCGKSLLAKHLAVTLEMRMFTVRFDTLISSYLGETGSNLRKIFDFISVNRCVLFIDEIDAIAKIRDDRNELGELKRVVISLLQNLDLIKTKSLLIAATNHPQLLDPAIWRRFQIVWNIDVPPAALRLRLFEQYIDSKFNEKWVKYIERSSEGLSGSDIYDISTASLRKKILNTDLCLEEALFISIIEHLKRNRGLAHIEKNDTRLITAILALKETSENKYSFQDLEALSGIAKSTLHNRNKNKNVLCR